MARVNAEMEKESSQIFPNFSFYKIMPFVLKLFC